MSDKTSAKISTKTDAWMPLWIGAYLADTQHLTRDEHGGYLLLIMAYWRSSAPLPDDDKRLAAIVRATPKEWKGLRPVLAEFFEVVDGVWRHKRIEAELQASRDKKTKASSKAQAAAQARWGNAGSSSPGNAPSMQQALHEECPTPTPSPTPSTHTVPVAPPSAPVCVDGIQPTAGGAICRRLIELGIEPTTCNPGHPKLAALLQAGATMEEFEGAARTAVGKGNRSFNYVLGIVQKQREEAATMVVHKGALPGKGQKPWYLSNSAIAEKAREMGLVIRGPQLVDGKFIEEQPHQFNQRVLETAGVTQEMVRAAKIDWEAT